MGLWDRSLRICKSLYDWGHRQTMGGQQVHDVESVQRPQQPMCGSTPNLTNCGILGGDGQCTVCGTQSTKRELQSPQEGYGG